MVLLKKLYSSTNLFDPVVFKEGINTILGVYSKKEGATGSLNGIGKSTTIRLIDYLLGSESGKDIFDIENYTFLKDNDAILEFSLDNKDYVIKKVFSEPDSIHLGTTLESLEKYTLPEFRKIMCSIFFREESDDLFIENGDFRNLIGFYVKDDLNNAERKSPLEFISQFNKKFDTYALNLYLMGIKNDAVYKFANLKDSYDELNKQRKKQIDKLKEDTGKEIEEVSSEMLKIENRIKVFEKSVNEYQFLEAYSNSEQKLIEIANEISTLLHEHNLLSKKLAEYRKSYNYSVEIDPKYVSQQYNEVKEVFGEIIKKKLEEVIEFRKVISENRRLFLKDKESEIESRLDKIESKISEWEKERSRIYKTLEEKRAFDSLKNTYNNLIEEKAKLQRLSGIIDGIEGLDQEILNKSKNMDSQVSIIKSQVNSCQEKILEISKLFFKIIDEVLGRGNSNDAVFSILPNLNRKNSPISINLDVPKSRSLGKRRLGVLVYDLTIFLNSIFNQMKLPKFLIHDGIFHAIDIKPVSNTLNYINNLSKEQKFQYIITANEGDLHLNKEESITNYNFNIKDTIIKTYTDYPEEMFFRRDLKK